jgi:hypothetical protein
MNDTEYLPAKLVRGRYKVCGKTLSRWQDDPALGFPQPIRINNNRFWRLDDLVRWERARAAGKKAAEADSVPPT